MGKLFIVATPIGNLEDITLRALKTLKDVDIIAAEDTRRTKKLLTHYGIPTLLTSYYEHNEKTKGPWLIERLKRGGSVALVTDAGTPGISDPGYRLVNLARENSIVTVAIPGPSALTAALSIAGLPTAEFMFKGFVPSKDGLRKRFLTELKGSNLTIVMYESPVRLKKTLYDIKDILGEADVSVAREMTKLHEEIIRGTVSDVIESLKDREIKGEVTLVIRVGEKKLEPIELKARLKLLLEGGVSLKDAVKIAAMETGVKKSHVYKEALEFKEKQRSR